MIPVTLRDPNDKLWDIDYDKPNYESHTVEAVKKLIKPGWVCYDVGANVGYYTFLLAQLALGGVVYAFEPLVAPRAALWRAIPQRQAGWAEIHYFECALSDATCEKNIKLGQDWELLDGGNTHCFFDTLDRLRTAHAHVLRPPDFMKIDIDGYESRMLRGARETLVKHKPLIVIELAAQAHEHHGQDVRDAIRTLIDCGYKLFHEDTGEDMLAAAGNVDALVQRYVPKGGSINVIAKV